MTGDDSGLGIDQNGAVEPELFHACSNLVDLGSRVCSGVLVEGNKLVDGPSFELRDHGVWTHCLEVFHVGYPLDLTFVAVSFRSGSSQRMLREKEVRTSSQPR